MSFDLLFHAGQQTVGTPCENCCVGPAGHKREAIIQQFGGEASVKDQRADRDVLRDQFFGNGSDQRPDVRVHRVANLADISGDIRGAEKDAADAVNAGNLLGLGKYKLAEMPRHLLVADVFYLIMNLVTIVGLWRNTLWGRICLLVMIGSQLVIYLGFPGAFAVTDAERAQIRGMVWLHVGTLAVFATLWLLASRT